MDNRECAFCRMYDRAKKIDSSWDERYRGNFSPRYYAALQVTHYDKDIEEEVGSFTYNSVPLHYCPYCGKKLR